MDGGERMPEFAAGGRELDQATDRLAEIARIADGLSENAIPLSTRPIPLRMRNSTQSRHFASDVGCLRRGGIRDAWTSVG